MNEENLKEAKVLSEPVYEGRLLRVYKDTVQLPNKKLSTREYIKHMGAVCIIAVDDENNVIIERQFRYPFDKVVTELPAGKLDKSDSSPLDAAKRELKEETGYLAGEWTYLGEYYPSVAYSDEIVYLYMARKLEKGIQELDNDEFLTVKSVPLKELIREVMENRIGDGKTQAAVLKVGYILNL